MGEPPVLIISLLMPPKIHCPNCEFPLDPGHDDRCPKCGEGVRGQVFQGLLEVDVAHSGEHWEEARQKIIQAVDLGILHGHSGVKIIHGWGATTGRASIRQRAVSLLQTLAQRTGGKLAQDKQNPGAHILWLNR
jgi:hypothetical protein